MSHLSYKIDNQIAVITLGNPPQNRLSPQMLVINKNVPKATKLYMELNFPI